MALAPLVHQSAKLETTWIPSRSEWLNKLVGGRRSCEVKWALGSITRNKASGSDGIPGELLKILKDAAVKCYTQYCQPRARHNLVTEQQQLGVVEELEVFGDTNGRKNGQDWAMGCLCHVEIQDKGTLPESRTESLGEEWWNPFRHGAVCGPPRVRKNRVFVLDHF